MTKQKPPAALWTCETATAGPFTPNHLRYLTDAGPKRGGGADTLALCGRVVAWDVAPVEEPLTEPDGWLCSRCVQALNDNPGEDRTP